MGARQTARRRAAILSLLGAVALLLTLPLQSAYPTHGSAQTANLSPLVDNHDSGGADPDVGAPSGVIFDQIAPLDSAPQLGSIDTEPPAERRSLLHTLTRAPKTSPPSLR
jgi:hypothetical protein